MNNNIISYIITEAYNTYSLYLFSVSDLIGGQFNLQDLQNDQSDLSGMNEVEVIWNKLLFHHKLRFIHIDFYIIKLNHKY